MQSRNMSREENKKHIENREKQRWLCCSVYFSARRGKRIECIVFIEYNSPWGLFLSASCTISSTLMDHDLTGLVTPLGTFVTEVATVLLKKYHICLLPVLEIYHLQQQRPLNVQNY